MSCLEGGASDEQVEAGPYCFGACGQDLQIASLTAVLLQTERPAVHKPTETDRENTQLYPAIS